VLQDVRKTDPLRSIPVVDAGPYSDEESDVLRRLTSLGVNAYVVKPVEFKQFVEAIADLGIFWAVLNEPPPGLAAGRGGGMSEGSEADPRPLRALLVEDSRLDAELLLVQLQPSTRTCS
jgi:hypothetical protein